MTGSVFWTFKKVIIPCVVPLLVVVLRGSKLQAFSNDVEVACKEDNCCGPVQATKSLISVGKLDWFSVLDLKIQTQFLVIVPRLVAELRGNQLQQDIQCNPSNTAALAADDHTRE